MSHSFFTKLATAQALQEVCLPCERRAVSPSHLAHEAAENPFSREPRKRLLWFLFLTTFRYVLSACTPSLWSIYAEHTHIPLPAPCSSWHTGEPHAAAHTSACARKKQLLICLRHRQRSAGPTAPLPPLSSFRHRACYRVIALLINVSPSRDNSVIFTVRFFRLTMRDIQWCNLLSVYYAWLGTPVGTVWSGARQDTHLSIDHFFLPLLHRATKLTLQIFFYILQNIHCIHTVQSWAWWNGFASFECFNEKPLWSFKSISVV